MFADSAAVLSVPLSGGLSLRASEATHEDTPVVDLVRVVLAPLATALGLAAIVTAALAGKPAESLVSATPAKEPNAGEVAANANMMSKISGRNGTNRLVLPRNE